MPEPPQQLLPSTGTWEDVKTRPWGSERAAGSQDARAFQDVSEELNQDTLLQQLQSRISSQGQRCPLQRMALILERARIPGPCADRRSEQVFCKAGGAQKDVYSPGKGHPQGSLGSTRRAWLWVPGGCK